MGKFKVTIEDQFLKLEMIDSPDKNKIDSYYYVKQIISVILCIL